MAGPTMTDYETFPGEYKDIEATADRPATEPRPFCLDCNAEVHPGFDHTCPQSEPRTDLDDALRELIRVSKSAGMNAASDFGYMPSSQQADEEEISEAIQTIHAAIEAEAAQGATPLHRPIKRIRARQTEERCTVDGEFWPCRNVSDRAAPRAEGLDPDVLIPLLHATHTSEGCVIPRHAGYHPSIAGRKSCEIRFERMVAHAARLSRPSDERVPEEER